MSDVKTTLSVESVTSESTRLNNISETLTDACSEMYAEINSLRENQAFVTKIAAPGYFDQIDSLNQIVPKFSEAILRFSRFLMEDVIKNYEVTDSEVKTKIEANLAESLAGLTAIGAIGKSGLDYSKISTSAMGATSGSFVNSDKVHKQYFEDGELQFVTREDGSVQIVKDGTVMGYTTQEGLIEKTEKSKVMSEEVYNSLTPDEKAEVDAGNYTIISSGNKGAHNKETGTDVSQDLSLSDQVTSNIPASQRTSQENLDAAKNSYDDFMKKTDEVRVLRSGGEEERASTVYANAMADLKESSISQEVGLKQEELANINERILNLENVKDSPYAGNRVSDQLQTLYSEKETLEKEIVNVEAGNIANGDYYYYSKEDIPAFDRLNGTGLKDYVPISSKIDHYSYDSSSKQYVPMTSDNERAFGLGIPIEYLRDAELKYDPNK